MKKDSKVNRVNEYIDYLTDPIFEAVVLGPKIKSQVRNVKLLLQYPGNASNTVLGPYKEWLSLCRFSYSLKVYSETYSEIYSKNLF